MRIAYVVALFEAFFGFGAWAQKSMITEAEENMLACAFEAMDEQDHEELFGAIDSDDQQAYEEVIEFIEFEAAQCAYRNHWDSTLRSLAADYALSTLLMSRAIDALGDEALARRVVAAGDGLAPEDTLPFLHPERDFEQEWVDRIRLAFEKEGIPLEDSNQPEKFGPMLTLLGLSLDRQRSMSLWHLVLNAKPQ